MELAELVYESLIGELIIPLKGVPNAFAPGSICEGAYREMLAAYEQLCERLDVVDEDADVERIIDSLLEIQRILCIEMFHQGAESAKR